MTHEEILTKAIEKAVAGGWSFHSLWVGIEPEMTWRILDGDERIEITDAENRISDGANKHWYIDYNTIIFNHDFARALWGDKYVYRADCIESPEEGAAGFQEDYTAWEFHLREMVIADDPIVYLGENI